MESTDPIVVNRAITLTGSNATSVFVEVYSPADGMAGYVVDFLATIGITSIPQLPELTPGDSFETSAQTNYRYYELVKNHAAKYLGLYVSLPGSTDKVLISRLKVWNSWPVYQENLLVQITTTENFLLEPGAKLWVRVDDDVPGGSVLWAGDYISIWLVAGELPVEQESSEISGGTPYSAVVATSSSVVLPANNNRKLVTLVNRGQQIVYLNFGNSAVANAGISLNPGGSSYVLNIQEINYKGAISAIVSSGNSSLEIMEAV